MRLAARYPLDGTHQFICTRLATQAHINDPLVNPISGGCCHECFDYIINVNKIAGLFAIAKND
jgi:hypothetical protein